MQWRMINSPLLHQNRLRHSEYLNLAEDAGFEVHNVERSEPTAESLSQLKSVSLAVEFADFDPVDLATMSAHIVLRKAR